MMTKRFGLVLIVLGFLALCVLAILAVQKSLDTRTDAGRAKAVTDAVRFVREEVENLNLTSEADRRFYTALSALTFVQTNLSAPRWGMMLEQGADLSYMPAGQCLIDGVGLCANHVLTFQTILEALDVPTRLVEIYYYRESGERLGHSMVEVFWSDEWRLFDISFGAAPYQGTPRNILSLEELAAAEDYDLLMNGLHSHGFYVREAGYDPLEFLGGDFDVLYDKTGIVRPQLADDSQFSLADIPTRIGKVMNAMGRQGDVRYQVNVPNGSTLIVEASHWNCDSDGFLAVGDQAQPFGDRLAFNGLSGTVTLSVTSDAPECYLAVADLQLW